MKFQSFHPLLKALMAVALIVIVLAPVCQLTGLENEGVKDDWKAYFAQTDIPTIVKDLMIITPIREELLYRGPAWLLLMWMLISTRLRKKWGDPRPWPEKVLFSIRDKSIRIWHVLFWLVIICSSVYWTREHESVILIFVSGLVFGWLLMRTKSLLLVIFLHIFWNTFTIFGVILRMFL